MRCGDNGIFKGMPVTKEQADLTSLVGEMYECFPTDGKYLTAPMTLANGERCEQSLIVCQSHGTEYEIDRCIHGWELLKFGDYMDLYPYEACVINPLGPWTGGIDVDCGCTNRKLSSDMGDGVTGGGLHGKDLSKADVSVNIACHQMAQLYHQPVEASCAIGDTLIEFMRIDGSRVAVPYEQVVRDARDYINSLGGFEKFAEWGLIRP